MAGGTITIRREVALDLTVTITRASGGALTVYSDAARTVPISMPHTLTTGTTYYLPNADKYTVSVLLNETEIASYPNSVYTVYIGESQGVALSPLLDYRESPGGPVDAVGDVYATREVQADGLRIGPNAGAPAYNFASGNGNLDEYGPFDLYWDAYNRKLHARSGVFEDAGDPPDLVLRRGGEDATGYPDDVVLGQIMNGTSMGALYWAAMANNGSYNPASAGILTKADGHQTATNNGGEMWLCVRAKDSWGNATATPAVILRSNGNLELMRAPIGLGFANSASNPAAPTAGYGQLFMKNNVPCWRAPNGTVYTVNLTAE